MDDGSHPVAEGHRLTPPKTTPLEEVPIQVAGTLEHIVGQLDILTQVGVVNDHNYPVLIVQKYLQMVHTCDAEREISRVQYRNNFLCAPLH